MIRRSDERGIALIMAVFALVIIGALVAGVFYTAQMEQHSGGNSLAGQQASDAAQAGIDYAIANWDNAWTTMGTGNSITIASTRLGSSPAYFNATVMATNGFTYLVTSTGQAKSPNGTVLASRAYGMIYKKDIPTLNVKSGVTVQGGVSVGGSATIIGNDSVPSGGNWATNCSGQTPQNQPAIRTDSGVSTHGSPNIVNGVSTNDTSVGTTITDVNQAYNTFINSANMTITGGTVNGLGAALTAAHTCDRSNTSNWGDPQNSVGYNNPVTHVTTYPCAAYFPIIHVTGDIKITGGVGQGVLLVDGNFTAGGGFEFWGLVIVKGNINKGNGNSNFYGGLLSESASITDDFTGSITIQYSSCAINTAVSNSAVARPITQRPFIQY